VFAEDGFCFFPTLKPTSCGIYLDMFSFLPGNPGTVPNPQFFLQFIRESHPWQFDQQWDEKIQKGAANLKGSRLG
jgi:hypothetical protein